MTDLVRVEVDSGIATIRLERPPVNALNFEVQDGLRDAAAEVTSGRDVSAVIIYGGAQVFAAGADVKELQALTYTDMLARYASLQAAVSATPRSPTPTAAASPHSSVGRGARPPRA